MSKVTDCARALGEAIVASDEYNITVNFPGSKDLIGRIVRVRITSAGESTLRGEMID